jgi:3-oxoacyl-[acyl-carrier protein] reductase
MRQPDGQQGTHVPCASLRSKSTSPFRPSYAASIPPSSAAAASSRESRRRTADVDHLQRQVSRTVLDPVWLTTSGIFSEPPFLAALLTFGIDRILFSVDYPYAPNAWGRAFLDRLVLAPADMAKLTHDNADALLKFKVAPDRDAPRASTAAGHTEEEMTMAGLLDKHIAVVTGSGSGIGRAIALGYAREGAQVAVLDVNGEAAAATAAAITAAGGKAKSFLVDVTERDKCRTVAAQVGNEIGQVSILVNNAGINRRNAFTADPEAVIKDWQDVLAVNLNGVFNVTHAFLAQLRASKGRIVNIGSIQSFVHVRTPNSPAYTTSKHGVLGFTRALAAELGKDGVRVNAIGPGLIETPLNEKVRASNPELVKIFLDHTPLGRAGKPEDIVGPAIFLASDLSAYVTGTIIMADGGYRSI